MPGSSAKDFVQKQKKVTWVHRRPRALGNFSMEATFKRLHDAWPAPKPLEHTVCDYSKGIMPRWRIWKQVNRLESDILHITGDINFACIAQKRDGRKVILTIHDVGMLDEGFWLIQTLKTLFLLLWPVRSCDAIVTVSEATKKDILNRCNYPQHKIHVIPSLISNTFQERDTVPDENELRFLHIGTAPNKNLAGHIAALRGTGSILTIVGQPNKEDMERLRTSGIAFDIKTGLSEQQMQETYAESTALLFCSLLEGFGMPIIEAQTIGVPVITSNIEPMSHVAGKGALFCNPKDPKSIQAQVKILIGDKSIRTALIEEGKENAKRFNETSAVNAHKALYSSI